MNDCLWHWTYACDEKCSCEKYISVNSDKGLALAKVYDAQTEKALQPVRDDWKRLFEGWSDED